MVTFSINVVGNKRVSPCEVGWMRVGGVRGREGEGRQEVKRDKGGEGGNKMGREVGRGGGRGKEGKRYIARKGSNNRNCRLKTICDCMTYMASDTTMYRTCSNVSPGFYFLPRPWRSSIKMRPAFIKHLSIPTARISRKCLAKLTTRSFFQLMRQLYSLETSKMTSSVPE